MSKKGCENCSQSLLLYCSLLFIFCVMQAPKIPGFLKTIKHRRFDFKTRYYDERKEKFDQRVLDAEKGRSNIRFTNHWACQTRIS